MMLTVGFAWMLQIFGGRVHWLRNMYCAVSDRSLGPGAG